MSSAELVPAAPAADGIKLSAESLAHYLARQLLLIESMAQPDQAFGAAVRGILQKMRPRLETELRALEAAAAPGLLTEDR